MKKFLLFLSLSAFLAIPATSLADGTGVGVVPSMTLQLFSLTSASGGSTAMQSSKFNLKQGILSFTVTKLNPDDGTYGDSFKGIIEFSGSAGSGTTTISNVFMNLSGLLLNADNKPSAAVGAGTVNGILTVTEPDSFGNTTTFTPSFTGSYGMNAALKLNTNGNTVSGTITPMNIVITKVGPKSLTPTPNFDNSSTILTNQIVPQPVILNVTLPAIPFGIATSIGTGNGKINITGTWNGIYMASNFSNNYWYYPGEKVSLTMNLTQTGNAVRGSISLPDGSVTPITGIVSGSKITMQFSDSDGGGDNSGIGSSTTITGTKNADGTMSGTYKSMSGERGEWGAATGTPGGVTGVWSVDPNSGLSGYAATLSLEQFGNTILGLDDSGDGIMGTINGSTIGLHLFDADTTKVTGTISGSMSGGAYPSGTTMSGQYTDVWGGSVDKGPWTATKN